MAIKISGTTVIDDNRQINNVGVVTCSSSPSGTAGIRNVTFSTSDPSGGSDGDLWIKYTA